ncbi:hypothetical protein [Helicobacter labacensis]|uniref:hypothetical protein n=1 Tax=Helicobacter labacensis TaxID=2316079 RepID=UPI0013CE349A|nr:hypothetical protein [Helicobacter labacensis]
MRHVLIDHSFKGSDHKATTNLELYKGRNFGLLDCTGSSHSLNNDFVKTKSADYEERVLVYVFSAVAYLKEPKTATDIKTHIGVYTKMAGDLGAQKVFALGTHSLSDQYGYVPSSSDHKRIIQDLQALALVRVFELKDSPI